MDKIYVDTPRWTYSKSSTDWKMKLTLVAELGALGLCLPGSFVFDFCCNLQGICPRFFPRCCRGRVEAFFVWIRELLLEFAHARAVISQGSMPPCPRRCNVLWETYFLPPQTGDKHRSGTFERGGSDRWIRSMEKFGPRVSLIGVRGTASVLCLKTMYPEFAHKIVDLPFVQPEYDVVEEDEVVRKQSAKEIVEILFIGREARRKGLDVLIRALCQLRQRGVRNFRLTVVSSMLDGPVQIPDEDWVSYRHQVSHAEAMELFKKSQIFVMPSQFESYGLVYLEAMASGCVAVVRDEDPQREFVDDGRAGVCVNEFSADDVANKLAPLIYSPEVRVRLALNGLRRYRDEFSQTIVRSRWALALRRLAGTEVMS